ncbi:hypothetical protein MLD38_027059 [Melastoma candidum]|uniref:Uncharacterized protein n=1 Tax=Melastoma candidum TaxID=119954 RepID=A0ACB9P2E9_9MYRT|nr:hypothetical protein MLD38_027059 [Melastoma candidum]
MAKASRGRRSPRSSDSRSRSGSDSRSRSTSRSPVAFGFPLQIPLFLLLFSPSRPAPPTSFPSAQEPSRRCQKGAGLLLLLPPKRPSPPPLRKSSPIRESLVLHIDSLSRNVHEGHLKEIFCCNGNAQATLEKWCMWSLPWNRIVNLPKGYGCGYVEFKTRLMLKKPSCLWMGLKLMATSFELIYFAS